MKIELVDLRGLKDSCGQFKKKNILTHIVKKLQKLSNTETVLLKSKKKKKFLEPDAFLDKQYLANYQACNFIAIHMNAILKKKIMLKYNNF